MAALKYVKPERIFLKRHPDLDERWVQDRIAQDPSILGLGDLSLKDKERNQPHAGRLDLLLQETDSNRRLRSGSPTWQHGRIAHHPNYRVLGH